MRRLLVLAITVGVGIPVRSVEHAAALLRGSLQPVIAEWALVLLVHLWFTSLTDNDPVVHCALLLVVTVCEPFLQLLQISVLQYLVVVHHTGFSLPLYVAVLVGLHLIYAAALLTGTCTVVCYKLHPVDLERRVLELRIVPAGVELPVSVCRSIWNVAWRIHITAVAVSGTIIEDELSLFHFLTVTLGTFGAISYRAVCRRHRLCPAVLGLHPLVHHDLRAGLVAHHHIVQLMRSLQKAAVSLADYLIWNPRPVLWSLHKYGLSPCAAYFGIFMRHLWVFVQSVYSAVHNRRLHLQHSVTKLLTALLTGLCLLVAKHHAFTEKANTRSSTRQDVCVLLMVTLATRYVHRVGYI